MTHTTKLTVREKQVRSRQTLRLLTHEILERKAHIAINVYEIGVRLTRIAEQSLWQADGHASFSDYLMNETDMGERTARRYR